MVRRRSVILAREYTYSRSHIYLASEACTEAHLAKLSLRHVQIDHKSWFVTERRGSCSLAKVSCMSSTIGLF